MKTKYYAIPVLVYIPASEFENAVEFYDRIKEPITEEIEGAIVYFAEDYRDGVVEIDHTEVEFSGMITKDCPVSTAHPLA